MLIYSFWILSLNRRIGRLVDFYVFLIWLYFYYYYINIYNLKILFFSNLFIRNERFFLDLFLLVYVCFYVCLYIFINVSVYMYIIKIR